MNPMLKLIRRFSKNESGVFAVIFGVLSVVLIATSGAVVDFVGVQQARVRAQAALDSATLALQPQIYTLSEAQLRSLAEDLLVERMTDSGVAVTVESANVVKDDGTLFLKARLTVPMSFVSLVGISEMKTRIASQATRKKLAVEVMMVLDNSGSMGSYSRMTNLKTAAANATEILFGGETTQPNVFIGIAPFTSFVNVGTSNANASWMDVAGNSSIANDNFDDDDDESTPYSGPVNRLALYDQLTNVSWRGCVDARPHTSTGLYSHLDTDDTIPVSSDPDTKIVPAFGPDTPDSWPGWLADYISDGFEGSGGSSGSGDDGGDDDDGDDDDGDDDDGDDDDGDDDDGDDDDGDDDDGDDDGEGDGDGDGGGGGGAATCGSSGSSEREQQERLCKYSGSINTSSWGPNFDCPSAELLPLTNVKQPVLDAIDAMVASGATNIHMGTIWGFRALSPTEPFTEGASYDEATAKVMIIMTDGENTMYSRNNMNGAAYYSPYGYPYNGRLGAVGWSSSQMRAEMDVRTLESCANAKAQGITIYTIGLNPPNNSTQNMLTDCATSASYAYFPEQASELDGVFTEIANQLSALRLAQ
jgi:Flp pilus assembly protein TadG